MKFNLYKKTAQVTQLHQWRMALNNLKPENHHNITATQLSLA